MPFGLRDHMTYAVKIVDPLPYYNATKVRPNQGKNRQRDKMEEVPWDVGQEWGCLGVSWGSGKRKGGYVKMLSDLPHGKRPLFRGHLPRGATVRLCSAFRRGGAIDAL